MVGCGAWLLGVLKSYDLYEHVQRRPTIPECNRERKDKLLVLSDMEPKLLNHYI